MDRMAITVIVVIIKSMEYEPQPSAPILVLLHEVGAVILDLTNAGFVPRVPSPQKEARTARDELPNSLLVTYYLPRFVC